MQLSKKQSKTMKSNFSAIVLAAGLGKRMKSCLPKVLHRIGDRPILTKTLAILNSINPAQTIIVVNSNNISSIRKAAGSNYTFAIQAQQLGTANAATVGLKHVKKSTETVGVFYGDDTAFYRPQTISRVFSCHLKSQAAMTLVTLEKDDPGGLGRIIRENGRLTATVEEKDASPAQKEIKEVSDGIYFFNKEWLVRNLPKVQKSKASDEFYLTDLVNIALKQNEKVETFKLTDPTEWHGVNTPQELAQANSRLRKIHIMGIAGAGASAVGGIASAFGWQVTGCDLNPSSAYTKNSTLNIQKGHDPKHLKETQMLVVSPAVVRLNTHNPELKAAEKLKIPVMTWQEFQGKYLQKNKFTITIAGGYGKSTTTAMIAQIMEDAKLDPTCEVGAKVISWGKNFRVGKSKYYVCEADEYNNNFLNYQPDIAVVLNLAWDHPDFFPNREAVVKSYQKFINKIKRGGNLITYGLPKSVISCARPDIKITTVKKFTGYRLSIIGDFRRQNADSALTVAKILGIDEKLAKKSISRFTGVGRRLEYKGRIGKTAVYDDYAVQPFTVKTTADALKDKFPDQKITLVFEPHTFSRINAFFREFVESLSSTKVDRVLITNVYAAREQGENTKLSQDLAKALKEKSQYTGSLDQTAAYLKKHLGDFDIILSMGAGDVYQLYDLLKN